MDIKHSVTPSPAASSVEGGGSEGLRRAAVIQALATSPTSISVAAQLETEERLCFQLAQA